jgi:ssRNA-specific RNase YbeY (16S rRNA maturation enzyme)
VACAVDAFERDQVSRIVLTRPAVEAGERLGFLPGDLAQKVDPYLRPLYDALYDLMGFDKVAKLFEKQNIEIAPLAYMRGRTLNHAFIILDEAQNTTPEQMKMFLTRIGIGARAVVTGDVTQIDLPRGQKSGLVEARRILKDVRGLAFTDFDASDVVRHPLVARIVDAYEKHEAIARRLPELRLSVQYPGAAAARRRRPQVRRWVRASCAAAGRSRRALRRCAEGRRLNRDYRGKDYATNVLTFPYETGERICGDLVLCRAVVEREAREQGKTRKPTTPTWSCMVCCICRATTTRPAADARRMEALEREDLSALGYADPYT